MQVPVEIAFKEIPKTEKIEDLIRKKVEKLEQICDYMVSCRIAVEQPQKHQHVGNPFRVRIEMSVPPGHRLVVKELSSKGDMHDPLTVVIRKAFRAAQRQLKELTEIQNREVKSHPENQVMGFVTGLFPDRGYGFIKTIDTQQEVYFHRNSVLHNGFEKIAVGTGVRFNVEDGEKGAQASTVEILNKPAAGHRE